jgi:hypothetical protein
VTKSGKLSWVMINIFGVKNDEIVKPYKALVAKQSQDNKQTLQGISAHSVTFAHFVVKKY